MEETEQTDSNGFSPVKLPSTTGPRPHRCEVCQRCFREVATLRKHEQLHRADRPYVCTTCGKSFLWSSNLKVHERVHTGERPYKCKICHRCFTQSNDLRRHERNVHMRGKLCGYKTQGRTNSQVNLATYQAFAMQQRAMLQQALTYESMRIQQTAAQTAQSHIFHPHAHEVPRALALPPIPSKDSASSSSSSSNLLTTSTLHRKVDSPIKLEQVTPPSTPIDRPPHEKRCLSTSSDGLQSPHSSNYTQGRLIHSAPVLMTSAGYETNKPPAYPHNPMMLRRPSYSPPESSTTAQGGAGMGVHYLRTQYHHHHHHQQEGEEMDKTQDEEHSPDTVMDLSVAKTPSRDESGEEIRVASYRSPRIKTPGEESGEEMRAASYRPPRIKTPGEESECDGKRDVTTTSAESGIHQCHHCNIFFYDYTMFSLHKSLHSPSYEENPFRCPSCSKHCQDRIEFMFHTVWHVKYPHTIPNYHNFRDEYVA